MATITQEQVELLIAPRGGLRLNLPADLISPVEMSDCQNVFFEDGLVKKRYGYKKFGGNLPLSGSLVGFDQFYRLSASQQLLAMTTKDIYLWNASTSEWDLLTEHTSIDNCDDNPADWTASANVTVAAETTEKKEGAASLKVTISDDFETGLAAYHDKAIGDISAYNHVRFWIKSDIALSAGELQFLVDDTQECASPLRTLNLPALAADTWTQVLLDLRDQNGSTSDLTNIASIGLKATADFGAAVLYVDQIDVYKCFTGSDEDFFSFDYMRKKTETDLWWICTNNVDVVKKFNGTIFTDLGGTPPKCRFLIQFKDHLHALAPTEAGKPMEQRDRWSDTGNPENWSTGNASYQEMPGSDWAKGAALFKGNFLIVFKERSIWVGSATGDSFVFLLEPKESSGVSCVSGRTLVALADGLCYLGWDNVYSFNGISSEPIGNNIQTSLIETIKPQEASRSFALCVEEEKGYWIFVTPSNESYPNTAWVYNYRLKTWTKHKFAHYLTDYGYYYLEQNIRWADLVGPWLEQNWRWGDRTILGSAPTTLFGDKDGYVYEFTRLENDDDGIAIDAYFDSKDFVNRNEQGRLIRTRWMGVDVYYKGPSLKVYYSTDKGKTWTLYGTLAASTTFDTPVRIRKRISAAYMRFRFRNAEGGEHFDFDHADLYREPAGERAF